jgi:hypothetical protein
MKGRKDKRDTTEYLEMKGHFCYKITGFCCIIVRRNSEEQKYPPSLAIAIARQIFKDKGDHIRSRVEKYHYTPLQLVSHWPPNVLRTRYLKCLSSMVDK